MEEGILPKLLQSDAYFARIPVNSVILLEPELSGTEEAVSVDYADVLVLRSMVKILAALTSLQSAYDWNLNAGFVEDQDGEDTNTTIETFRAHNPNLLGIRDQEQLGQSPKISRRRNHSLSDCIPYPLARIQTRVRPPTLSEQALRNQKRFT